jgi:predicted Zn-dependent protease
VGGEAPGTLSSEDRAVMEKAIDQMKAGKAEAAWKLVEPLGESHPANLDVQRLLCRLGHVPDKKAPGMAACQRAKELAPSLPDPWIDCAHAQLMRKELPEALVTADEAASRARNVKTRKDIWLWIGRLYGQMGALTRAEEAVELAVGSVPEAELTAARDTVARERRNLALPRPAAGQPRPEPAAEMGYVAAFRKASRLFEARKMREGKAALEEARRHMPTAPGLDLLACEIDLRQNRPRQGEQACQRALDAMKDLPRAHYLLGHAKLQSGARDAAAAELKRSIDLDPKEIGPWEALADLYRASGKRQELAALKAEYEKLFSRPLK